MSAPFQHLLRELPPMFRLALPVVTAEVGWMAMGVVDTMMVGRVSAEALGAVSIGRALFMFVAVCGIGLLLGLDTLVSQAFGAGEPGTCRRAAVHGVYLALLIAVPLTFATRGLGLLLPIAGVNREVTELAWPYIAAISWSALPIFLYTALRRYLQAMNRVRAVMFVLISANAVNFMANWILIYGNWGAPALGAEGAGWATCASSLYLGLSLVLLAAAEVRRHPRVIGWWHFHSPTMGRLIRLGIPASAQLTLEVGVFALATVLIGRLDAASLAAHQIAIIAASVTYMVPLGVSAAAAVRVGQWIGRDDLRSAAASGWAALWLGGGFMSLMALLFVTIPGPLIRLFSTDPDVVRYGIALLMFAALFQLFDGLQIVATGALRGAGNTRTSLIASLVGYWVLGLPLGYGLCFGMGWGANGLWAGLSAGIITACFFLVAAWLRKVRGWQGGLSVAG